MSETGIASDAGSDGLGGKRSVILAEIARAARLDRAYVAMAAMSAALATLGLLQSSTAVVIGSMLVSPLMGPIIGLGFGLATVDSALLRRSGVTLAAGMAVGIAVSLFIVVISPIKDVTPEILGRTRPSLLDLGVAVAGGLAGGYAVTHRQINIVVGVAIATALMPPLGTIGFGLATGRPDFALGALLLFVTNTLAIAAAATVVARISHFGARHSPKQTRGQIVAIVLAMVALAVPLGISLRQIVWESRVQTAVRDEITRQAPPESRISSLNVDFSGGKVRVDAVLLAPRYDPALETRIDKALATRVPPGVDFKLAQLRLQTDEAQALQQRMSEVLAARQADTLAADQHLTQFLAAALELPPEAVLVDSADKRLSIAIDEADTERMRRAEALLERLVGWDTAIVDALDPTPARDTQ